MKQALRARALYKKVTLMSTAFVLAVSSLTASMPFILSSDVGAAPAVDTQKPTVNLVNAHGEVFPAGVKVTINAVDETGLSKIVGNVSKSGVAGIYKTHQKVLSGELTESLIVDTAGYANGAYTLKYNALDTSDNLAQTKSFKFTVDSNAPRIEVKGSAWGNTYLPSSNGLGNVFKEVSFKLSDNDLIARVFVNGTARTITPSPWSDVNAISVGVNGGKYGQNILSVYDQAGNESIYTFTLDNVSPTVTVKGGSDSIGVSPYSKVSFKLYDAYKVSKVIVNGTVIDLTDSIWSDLNNVRVGSMYGVAGLNTIQVFDVVGNETVQTFTLDAVPPSATFSYSNANGTAITKNDVVVTLFATEAIQTPDGWTPAENSQTVFTKTYASNSKQKMVITDLAGNNSSELSLEVKRIDKNAPLVTGVTDNTSVNTAVMLTVFDPKYQGYDGFDQLNGLTVNGEKVATTAGPDKTYTYTISEQGRYKVVATDKAGNPTILNFQIETGVPELSITNPETNSEQSKQFTVNGTASDSLSGIANLNYVITPLTGGYGSAKEAASVSSGPIALDTATNLWTFDTGLLVTGFYAVEVIAVDGAGNEVTQTIEVSVDADGPVVDYTVSGRTLIGTTSDPGRAITVTIADFDSFTVIPESTAWTLTIPSTIAGGTYNVAVESTDFYGNQTSFERFVTFSSIVAPVPVVTTPDEDDQEEQDDASVAVAQAPVVLPASINPAAFQQVLGDSTPITSDDGDADNEGVEGTSTENIATQAANSDSNQGRFMGLAWYWWLLILAGASLIGWWIASSLRKEA